MRVVGLWSDTGEWYPGTVLDIIHERKSCHIKYDDSDEDGDIAWENIRILDELEDG